MIAPYSLFVRRWLPVLYAAVILTSAWLSHFAVLINDVFLLRWQAEHLSLGTPESFYNGFFPIGYPLVLRAVSATGNPIFTLMLFQIALAIVYVTMVQRLLVRMLPSNASIIGAIALPLMLFSPPVIHAILSATPDFFAALAALMGFLFILREGRWNFILAGVCLGLGCLFRSHLLVLSIALALSLLLFQKERRSRTCVEFCIGTLPFIITQGLIQVWSGHGFFENAQAFNIWKTMHGMDWSNPPALGHAKAFGVIMEDPALFISSVCNWLFLYFFYFVPLIGTIILAWIRSRSGAIVAPRSLIMVAMAALAYLGVTAAGGSVSAFTPIIPIAAACVIPLIEFALSHRSLKFRKRAIATIATTVWIAGLTGLLISTMRTTSRVNDYGGVKRSSRSLAFILDRTRSGSIPTIMIFISLD